MLPCKLGADTGASAAASALTWRGGGGGEAAGGRKNVGRSEEEHEPWGGKGAAASEFDLQRQCAGAQSILQAAV
eukprot:352012-Chlamydomonas_euryale.AAC.4